MTVDDAIAKLVRAGCAITPKVGSVPITVGLMQRTAPGAWFWFAAGGETEFDGHVIEGDAKVLYDGGAVVFTSEGKFAGYLTTLVESFDEEAAMSARRVLDDWRERYGRDANLRGFITREIERRS